MPRNAETYVCQSCGNATAKWAGRCEACGEWNTIELETAEPGPPGSLGGSPGKSKANRLEFASLAGGTEQTPRILTGNSEFDRACGGGLAPGSALLIGGDPGVGKSSPIFQAKRRRRKFDCARAGWRPMTRPCRWLRRPLCATSSPA